MRRLVPVLAAAVLALVLALAGPAGAPAQAATLSETGDLAVDDLRTCLASRDVLNVYYLIDNSQSLEVEDDGTTPGSDPEYERAAILGNSLAQLGSLGGTTVNWAAGFFSSDFEPAIDWTSWAPSSSAELEAAIRAKQPDGYTNWLVALQGVQGELIDQPSGGSACQLVVWLTDGAIDVEGDDRATADAINDLCGQPINADGHAPTQGFGVLNAFRQAGVVVMGTLLAQGATRDAAEVMWPLVEGSGAYAGGTASCGQPDPPASAVHGAVVDASDPSALARVFLELGSRIGGGYPEPLAEDGSFWVDPGVSRFQIVLGSGEWTLTAPAAAGVAPLTPATTWPNATTTASSGATLLEVIIADANLRGSWRLESTDVREVFLFSDLSIAFDEKNSVELGTDGEASATLAAQVVDATGAPAPVDVYETAALSAWTVGADGARRELTGVELDEASGAVAIPIPGDLTAAQIVVTASLDPLVTSPHQLQLAPVTSQQTIATVLPVNFPRVATLPVQLDPLEGAEGEARGAITVQGPQTGGAGQVCIREDPVIVSDVADRGETWEWDVSSDLDQDGCVEVPEGGEVRIGVAASNEQAAEGEVSASVPLVLGSAAGDELTQDVPVVFRSTHPVNEAAVGLLALLLLILGVLLPLAALWLVNWRTTRLDVDAAIQRASFPVRVGPAGVQFPDMPTTGTGLSERFRYRGQARDVRSIDDADLGRLRARVSWFPFAAPRYVIEPPSGRMVLAAKTSARAASSGERTGDGGMVFRQLPLDAFWAIVIARAELQRSARGDEVGGTAVIYHRFDAGDPQQYRDRVRDIAQEGSLSDTLDRMRAQAAAAAVAPLVKQGRAAPQPPPTPATTTGVPPRGTTTTPPRPTAGPPPPRTGGAAAPSRSGGEPPPRSGGAPPSRPGSAPPPRGS